MELNADFDTRVVVHSDQLEWNASPMVGVDRCMLNSILGEVARATTIVRYAPKSKFSAHPHTSGEEFIVLDGVFQDEHGEFPEGTYVGNPMKTSHTPGSDKSCTIHVKLWQFNMEDRNQFCKTMADELAESVNGLTTAELHSDAQEVVTYSQIATGSVLHKTDYGGIEIFVISGSVIEGGDTLGKGAWLRLPDSRALSAVAGDDSGKYGHLAHVKPPTV